MCTLFHVIFFLLQSPVPSNKLLIQNTSPVPHFGPATIPDQLEGPIMPPIEENNCMIKSSNKYNSETTSDVSCMNKSLSDSQITNIKNNNNPIIIPQFVDSEGQSNVEKTNVSKSIFIKCLK